MLNVRKITRCAVFLALLCMSSNFKIPLPFVPISLQWFSILLCAYVLSPEEAIITVSLYVGIGLLGLPVFSGGGGIGYIFKPSFGYLLGFIPAAGITSWAYRKGKGNFLHAVFSGFCGFFVLYAIALLYLYLIFIFVLEMPLSVTTLFGSYFLTFVPSDSASIVLACWIVGRLPAALLQR